MASPFSSSGAHPPSPPRGRRWKKVRIPCGEETSCFFRSGSDLEGKAAQVNSLSGIGITLDVDRRLTPGQVFTADLMNTLRGFICRVEIRVNSVTEAPDGRFQVEGAFTHELRNVEVRGLVPEEAFPAT